MAGLKSLLSRLTLLIYCIWKFFRMKRNHVFEFHPVIMRDGNVLLRHRQEEAPVYLHKLWTETVSDTRNVCSQAEASTAVSRRLDLVTVLTPAQQPATGKAHRFSCGKRTTASGILPQSGVGVQEAGRGTGLCWGSGGGKQEKGQGCSRMSPWWDASWKSCGSVLAYGRAENSSCRLCSRGAGAPPWGRWGSPTGSSGWTSRRRDTLLAHHEEAPAQPCQPQLLEMSACSCWAEWAWHLVWALGCEQQQGLGLCPPLLSSSPRCHPRCQWWLSGSQRGGSQAEWEVQCMSMEWYHGDKLTCGSDVTKQVKSSPAAHGWVQGRIQNSAWSILSQEVFSQTGESHAHASSHSLLKLISLTTELVYVCGERRKIVLSLPLSAWISHANMLSTNSLAFRMLNEQIEAKQDCWPESERGNSLFCSLKCL